MKVWLGCWNRADKQRENGVTWRYGDVILVYDHGPNSFNASGEGGLAWVVTTADTYPAACERFGPVGGIPQKRLNIDSLVAALDAAGDVEMKFKLEQVRKTDVNARPDGCPEALDADELEKHCEVVNAVETSAKLGSMAVKGA